MISKVQNPAGELKGSDEQPGGLPSGPGSFDITKVPYDQITADMVKQLQAPADKFLCKLTDNWPSLKFGGFRIRDIISGYTLVEVQDDEVDNGEEGSSLTDEDDPSTRVIKYHLGPDFLRLRTVGLTLNFSNGPQAIQKMEMVERHYFRGKVIRSYDFKFGFVIPGSTNSWEFIYDLPELTDQELIEISSAPWEVKSDSFFFADGKLIIHNRAEYNYAPLDM